MSDVRVCTDLELLRAWRQGDAASGEQLFERHFDTVVRFFKNKLDDPPDDIVQRTFLACVRSRDRIRGESSFRTYVLAIARNLLKNHYRDRAREPDRVDFSVDSVSAFSLSPSSIVARHREQQTLLEALRRIPLEDQIALEMHYWEELTSAQIGEVLSIPIGTAKTRLRRAKQRLRASMERLSPALASSTTITEDLDRWAHELRDQLLED